MLGMERARVLCELVSTLVCTLQRFAQIKNLVLKSRQSRLEPVVRYLPKPAVSVSSPALTMSAIRSSNNLCRYADNDV